LILTRRRTNAAYRQRIGPYIDPLQERGIKCEVQELAEGRARRRQLRSARDYSGVWLHRKTLTRLDAFLFRRRARRVIYDFDDAIVYRAGSDSPDPVPMRMKRFSRTVRLADLVIAGNERLEEIARECGATNVAVIPTGLDTSRYIVKTHTDLDTGDNTDDSADDDADNSTDNSTDNIADDSADDSADEYADEGDYDSPDYYADEYGCDYAAGIRLVWIGSRSTLKQLRLFTDMLDEVAWQFPGITLRIIADDQLIPATLQVENLDWTRDGEAQMLADCDIGIAPLPDTPFARGKCAFKVLQYMASGLPVVTSPIGANAEYVIDQETGFHATDNYQWTDVIGQLAGDCELRARMGAAGRERACSEFDFSVLAPKVCDAIAAALE